MVISTDTEKAIDNILTYKFGKDFVYCRHRKALLIFKQILYPSIFLDFH